LPAFLKCSSQIWIGCSKQLRRRASRRVRRRLATGRLTRDDSGTSGIASPILTPDQRIRVFVSSTLHELTPERAAARAAIEALRFTPVLFELAARPHPPRALYRAYLEQSDVFVGIYSQSYGWVAPSMEVSGLEDEYLMAGSRPKLVYVKAAVEREPRLVGLLERISSDDVSYRRFGTPQELADLLADDLALLVSERFAQRPRRAGAARSSLPAPASSFVGREPEIDQVIELLWRDDVRLVTLTGPGGIGKTRLALEAAQHVADAFDDGVAFVALASVADPEDVAPAVGEALDVQVNSSAPVVETLCSQLADHNLLLVLDNMEHVVAAAPLVGRMLAAAPGLTVLATSRVRLDVTGEHLFHVPPLSLPDPGEHEAAAIAHADAVRLFSTRAQAAGWTTTEADASIVAEIVRRLDGLPLAIELAAAQARLVPAELIHTRLRRRLDLAGGPRDAEERHRTLRSTIAWSYDLLDEPARRFFETLAVFTGGFSIDAAAAVAEPGEDVEELLASLVDASLITTGSSPVTGVRFDMLETLREYAAERLEGRGGRAEAAHRHVAFYAGLVDEAYAAPVERLVVSHLSQDEERDNLGAALWEAIRTSPAEGVRLAGALDHLWSSRGLAREGREAIAQALEAAPDAPAAWRARARLTGAWLTAEQGDYAEADRQALEALELFRELGDARKVGEALQALGWSAEERGDSERAARYFEESYLVFTQLPDESLRVITALHLAKWLTVRGDLDEARRLYLQALKQFEVAGLDDGRASVLLHLGTIDERLDDVTSARKSYETMAAVSRRIDNKRLLASALVALAGVDGRDGRTGDAISGYSEALDVNLELGNRPDIATCLERVAVIALSRGRSEDAARMLGKARALRDATGSSLPEGERREVVKAEILARDRLGEAEFERGADSGAALSPGELRALVDGVLAAVAP